MVVDDSAVVRGLIARQLEADADIQVVCTAANGEIAVREIERRPVDVVILDVEMPVMDGLTALTNILQRRPATRIVMASTLTKRNAEISLRAMQLGASDYVAKPESGLAGAEAFGRELISKVKALGPKPLTRATGVLEAPAVRPARPRDPMASGRSERIEVLAIGASTGGPPALVRVLEGLKGCVRQPILITQHMPATFTALLAEQLARAGDRPCSEAKQGEPVLPGRCYVAPGGWHMVVERTATGHAISLNQDPPENFCRPAVDPMLRSVAAAYGASALAVILTGMGADGAKGCSAVSAAGGRFVVQDEATSVVWGMPGAAAATGLADATLPLEEIAPWLRRVLEPRQ
jgi:two-component system chemotaxis response regulator CheB